MSYKSVRCLSQKSLFPKRYTDLDGKSLPSLLPWIRQNLGVDLSFRTPSISPQSLQIPSPLFFPRPFTDLLRSLKIPFSSNGMRRVVRSHGQTLADVMPLRLYQF